MDTDGEKYSVYITSICRVPTQSCVRYYVALEMEFDNKPVSKDVVTTESLVKVLKALFGVAVETEFKKGIYHLVAPSQNSEPELAESFFKMIPKKDVKNGTSKSVSFSLVSSMIGDVHHVVLQII
jgi:hypothetical protein